MATDYGTGVASLSTEEGGLDLDPYFRKITGPMVVVYAVARRFVTRRGSLWWAPDAGFDLRGRLMDGVRAQDIERLAGLIATEAERDERVLNADVTVVFDASTEALTVTMNLTLADGVFPLVLHVSKVSTSLILAG